MIIIWGTKNRVERLGVVADWYDSCGLVRPFLVTNYYSVGHIYYIPLGSGSLRATSRECWSCGTQFYGSEKDYSQFLSCEAAKELMIGELLRRTNGDLKNQLDRQQKKEAD